MIARKDRTTKHHARQSYYLLIASILLLLTLSANTAFADFPRVCHFVAEGGYSLQAQFPVPELVRLPSPYLVLIV
jgi:hypothetical protein